MKKSKRQEIIIKLIAENPIGTQDELVDALKRAGVEATQSTVSRDIRELELRKTMINGQFRYKAPVMYNSGSAGNIRFDEVLEAGLTSVVLAKELLVIRTISGMAMAVAAAIDALHLEEIAGTIAGDDTIMVALKADGDKDLVLKKIEELKRR